MSPEWLPLLYGGLLAVAHAGGLEPADAELLEFLGSFETADARWLDPLGLDERAAETPATPQPDASRPDPSRLEKKHAN